MGKRIEILWILIIMNQHKRRKIRSVLKMDKCRYCKSKENLTIDHKIPTIKGGKDNIENLQCLCKRCNTVKSAMYDSEVRRIFRLHDTIEKEKRFRKLQKIDETQIPIPTERKKFIPRLLEMLALWRKRSEKGRA